MLSMNIQQQGSDFAKGGHGTRLIVDVDAISFIRRYFAPNDDLVAVCVEPKAIEFAVDARLTDGFDHSADFAGSNHIRGSLCPREQSESVDNKGFTGSGFSGQDRQSV